MGRRPETGRFGIGQKLERVGVGAGKNVGKVVPRRYCRNVPKNWVRNPSKWSRAGKAAVARSVKILPRKNPIGAEDPEESIRIRIR